MNVIHSVRLFRFYGNPWLTSFCKAVLLRRGERVMLSPQQTKGKNSAGADPNTRSAGSCAPLEKTKEVQE